MKNSDILVPYPTGDGSYTFFSKEYGETFHSHSGAKEEAEKNLFNRVEFQKKLKNNLA